MAEIGRRRPDIRYSLEALISFRLQKHGIPMAKPVKPNPYLAELLNSAIHDSFQTSSEANVHCRIVMCIMSRAHECILKVLKKER